MAIFITSDSHFFHKNALKFYNQDGTKLRPWEFTDKGMEEMNEVMIKRWNSVVSETDEVIHLGDVTFNNKNLHIMDELNGAKRLILGNHDNFDYDIHSKYFFRVHSSYRLNKMLLTHIPVHSDSIPEGFVNVHGHIHGEDIQDPRYLNVCVEHTMYTPISVNDLEMRILDKQRKFNNES